MKKFLQNKKLLSAFVIVILILTILGTSVSLRNKRNSPLFIQGFGNDIVAIGSRVIDLPLSIISGGVSHVNNVLNAERENDYLKSQITALGQTQARDQALKDENAQLKAALKLKDSLTDYSLINASVISRSSDTWSDLLVINKGSSSGVKKNQAVMSSGGVIGRVLEVSAFSSKVELISTTDKSANRFSVEAKASDGKSVHGIIDITSNGNLALTQVVDSKKLKKGTKVYTSGLGGNSPKGLLIGTIGETTHDSFGLSNLININPAGNINNPSVVSVVVRKVAN